MAFATLGDLHLGARGGNEQVLDFKERWFRYFFADLQKRGIQAYVQLGDAFDVRRALAGVTYEWVENVFIPLHREFGISGVYIDGNHDLPYLETNRVSWVQVLEDLCPDYITRIKEPCDFDFGFGKCCMLPWITKENLNDTMKAIEESEAKICFGHLELGGFDMYKGSVCEESRFNLNAGHFSKFEIVQTGHFHTKSKNGVIEYVGTPYPLTWQDWADAEAGQRGYHIINEDMSVDFVPNSEVNSMFQVLTYNWAELNIDDTLQLQFKSISELEDTIGVKGKIVKVVVVDRGNAKHYKDFVNAMRQCKTIDVTYIDNTVAELGGDLGEAQNLAGEAETSELKTQTDILQVLHERVDEGTLGPDDKDPVKKLLTDLHSTAKEK